MPSSQITSDGVVYLPDSGERIPMSVVWTTLPGVSFLFPLIGHVGIANSEGVIFDFSGPYQITVGSLMGGPAKRVWTLNPSKIGICTVADSVTEAYDKAVRGGACEYGKRSHNLILDNCHSHVASVLNRLEYGGRSDWNQIQVFKYVWQEGKWVEPRQKLYVFGPFLIMLLLIVIISIAAKVST